MEGEGYEHLHNQRLAPRDAGAAFAVGPLALMGGSLGPSMRRGSTYWAYCASLTPSASAASLQAEQQEHNSCKRVAVA
jgi:hypothetical protein